MRFSVSKAAVYGVTMFVALAIGLSISGNWAVDIVLIASAAGGVFSALVFGFLMRDVSMEIAGATPATIEAAVRSAWTLRSFRSADGGSGVVRYARGAGILGDVFTVQTTATGVTLTGAANILSVVRKKAAGR